MSNGSVSIKWVFIALTLVFSAFASAQNVNLKDACNSGRGLLLKSRDGFQVNIMRYGFEDAEHRGKLIVIVPPTGGVNMIDKGFARMFCRSGYLAIILRSYTGSDEVSLDLDVHTRVIGKAVKAFRMIRIQYPQKFFGILGTSAGGIVASTLVDDFADDLDAIFTIVSGAPLYAVIARAGEKGLKKLREDRMRAFGFQTIEDYEMALAKRLHVSIPVNVPPQIKVGMIVARKDTVVPP
ncbi:MAG: hypothetical protein AAF202_04240, partial [Pseudomonadota bacterium]